MKYELKPMPISGRLFLSLGAVCGYLAFLAMAINHLKETT